MARLPSTTEHNKTTRHPRGQSSLEGLIIAVVVILLAAIGIGYLATFQAPTTALVLVKEDVLRQINRLDSFHQILNVDYTVETTTNAISLNVNVEPDLSAAEISLLEDDQTALVTRIQQKTNYASVAINWQ